MVFGVILKAGVVVYTLGPWADPGGLEACEASKPTATAEFEVLCIETDNRPRLGDHIER